MERGFTPDTRVYRILVVEDNLDQVHSTCMLLREMGHQVEYVVNGYVALDAARRFHPDFVVCDLGLPGVTGFEVCAQIKSDPELRGARVIALSGYDLPEYRERALQVGFEQFISKPADPKTLLYLFGDARAPVQRG